MKNYAQQGYGPKDKLTKGFVSGVISGAILSPKYCNKSAMEERIAEIDDLGGEILMDPELYAARHIASPNANLGYLETWKYFKAYRRASLISGVKVDEFISESLEEQASLDLTGWIAPNVYIDAADSIETAISLNVISQTKIVASKFGNKPVYATLAMSREAILDRVGFQDLFDALTAMDTPPDGYYLLVGGDNGRDSGDMVRSDLHHPKVIAGWMYMNHVLSINGARVINGYCHLLGPLLGICGAEAAANGWHSGLRQFSMSRYVRESTGGRIPLIRYVSAPLMARIRQTDYLAYKSVAAEIANNMPLDADYEGAEISRTAEALQSWEAISALCKLLCTGNLAVDLDAAYLHLSRAAILWKRLQAAGFSQEIEANMEWLAAVQEGIKIFKEWAEIA